MIKIQFRRDTAANWTSNNPTLAAGEIGFETDTKRFKLGSGSTAWTALSYRDLTETTINFIIDGNGAAISTGVKGDVEIPFACTITQVTTLAAQSGSIVVDIWKDTYANFPPTVADTITASAKPTLSTATKAQDSTLTGWTTSIAAGSVLRFNVDSATTVERVTVSLKVLKT